MESLILLNNGNNQLSFLKRYVTLIAAGRCHLVHIVFIALLGLIAYSNTFNVPFQWDKSFIPENPIIKDPSYFLEPSKAEGFKQFDALKSRYIGYLTFALNYKMHGLDVTGYHIVNLCIHIFNSLLVYLLVILTFRTPFMVRSLLKEHSKYIALFAGLSFVSHPVQTEAVTYIFQRLASLMSFFYLTSLVVYIGSRLSKKNTLRYMLYAVSLVSTALAMKTKENAFTLPMAIALYEFLFFTGSIRHRVLRLIPLLLMVFIIPLTLTGTDKPVWEIISQMGPATRGYLLISREDYLFIQFRVLVTYLRLLFLPVNQNLDYDYPVFHSFFHPQVFLSFLFLLLIFGFGVYLFHRSKSTVSDLRLIAFGIFWFFLTLSVESSLIPLNMILNEYRLYLPSVGIFLAITTGTSLLLKKLGNRKVEAFAVSFLVLIPLVFSYATYVRNTVWGTEISLWEDVVRKSPRKARVRNNLGVVYMSKGLSDKAIEQYRIALRISPDYVKAHNNLGDAYKSKGLIDRAIEHYTVVLKLKPDLASVHNKLGFIYFYYKDRRDKAIEHYETALELSPDNARIHLNLGIAYKAMGLTEKAERHLYKARELSTNLFKSEPSISGW